MADGLLTLAEFEARYALFDIEYTERSALGIDGTLLRQELPAQFSQEFSTIRQNIADLFQALRTGAIPLKEAEGYIQDLVGLTEQSKESLLARVQAIARDNDRYLGQAARVFGKAFFTVNLLPAKEKEPDEEMLALLQGRIALQDVSVLGPQPQPAPGIRPAILPILSGAAGAGFPNVVIDPDGVLRRIEMVRRHGDHYFAQLALAPLLDWLGGPRVVLSPGRLVLEGARLPDGATRTLSIPLDGEGRMMLNWPPEEVRGFLSPPLLLRAGPLPAPGGQPAAQPAGHGGGLLPGHRGPAGPLAAGRRPAAAGAGKRRHLPARRVPRLPGGVLPAGRGLPRRGGRAGTAGPGGGGAGLGGGPSRGEGERRRRRAAGQGVLRRQPGDRPGAGPLAGPAERAAGRLLLHHRAGPAPPPPISGSTPSRRST